MLRRQYHFRRVGDHVHIWNVVKLLALSQDLPVEQVPLSKIREIDEPYWFDLGDAVPTCRAVMDHARLSEAADLSWPVLLCAEGRVMDGMHRIMKAFAMGRSHISARRLRATPEPDHVDVAASELRY